MTLSITRRLDYLGCAMADRQGNPDEPRNDPGLRGHARELSIWMRASRDFRPAAVDSACQHAPRTTPGVGAPGDHRLAVDEDPGDPDGIAVGIGEGRGVGDGFGIEDHDVGDGTRLEAAPVSET